MPGSGRSDRRPPDGDGSRPLGALSDLVELLGGNTARSRRFLGGVVVGALVGAALAGSSLLRRHERRPPPGS